MAIEKYIGQLTPKTSPATGDILMIEDSEDTKKIDYDALADAILNKLTSKKYTVAGASQTLVAALDALNSKTQAYNYTASSGSFLDWVLSTFTANGDYYVIYATTNWTGWAGSNTGICKVIRRNNDYYLEAYIADTVTATNQSFYVNRYTGGSWLGWTKIPSRYEMDTLNRKIGSAFNIIPPFSSVNTSIGKNLVLTMNANSGNYRGFLLLFVQGNATVGEPQICMFSWGNNGTEVKVNHILGAGTTLDGATIDGTNVAAIKVKIPMIGYSVVTAFANANVLSGSMALENAS